MGAPAANGCWRDLHVPPRRHRSAGRRSTVGARFPALRPAAHVGDGAGVETRAQALTVTMELAGSSRRDAGRERNRGGGAGHESLLRFDTADFAGGGPAAVVASAADPDG